VAQVIAYVFSLEAASPMNPARPKTPKPQNPKTPYTEDLYDN
jgi:hypothetical protein